MATTFDEKIPFEKNGLQLYGLFKRGDQDRALPLVVLLHGGGTTAAYFDNSAVSVVQNFHSLGHDVLNISRPGYAGNAIPASEKPMTDSIPVFIDFIEKVYTEKSSARHCNGGIVLFGHSLGGAFSLSITAEAQDRLPLLGVSALGCAPVPDRKILLVDPDPEPSNPRYVVETNPENIRKFMGEVEWLNLDALEPELVAQVFEPGIKSEIREFSSDEFYDYLVNRVYPAIRVPVQYLCAESEIVWGNEKEARPIFDNLVSRFTNAPEVDSAILPRGGHNYEFSLNAGTLWEKRKTFLKKLINKAASFSSNGATTNNIVKEGAFTSVPVIDYAEAASPSTRPAFLKALKAAIVNVGFFYLKNTGVPDDVQSEFTKQSIALFNLPLEKKLEIEMVNSKHFLGYARLGQEITALKNDYREQFDFATELPAPGPEEPLYRNLRGPNQWPDPKALPHFRAAIESYMDHIDKLAESFKSLVAEALDLPPTAFDQFFDYPQQNKLKLIKYPEPINSKANEDVQGVGPHKDSCFLTFLMQGTPHTGLEVQNKAGTWLPVKPIPGTLVINIGRALEAITGGVCTATTHRVNLRAENYKDAQGNSLGPRYSFAIFQGVSLDLGMEKINISIPQHIKDLVKDEKVRSDAEATFNQMFNGNIGEGTLIARITSHQDVAQRWYPGLLAQALQAQKDKYQ
ncbi:oxidoreductase, 2OG-Fe(II) oxygenase family, putative [Talaromyces stipitatus ATCC 10500]|uniref:Oxidoreductase, 2OG-Fe(II) oxygenase family, putative n=1 Tax=Talaromyces stipitatus (strain ATCC 10500 / CBS 375.48 / QM 6759 / NRRL 1006) TaxID=441959 RepID=B8M429_TALSN|nr:oxidoreductase, 2OG-Fe(II) oxygenase family, putative [Talaromyces stipitatus ATCC 10500]EED20772.1 oxidoreductase, 2OG-Fe(II) oxygenase family, putative [Talaromyces stipitatus ATCC 10500]